MYCSKVNSTSKRSCQKKNNTFSHFFRSWLWVFLFSLICLATYAHAVRKKATLVGQMQEKIAFLEKQKEHLEDKQQRLQLEIASQTDPAWIELVLMKHLGVVPEGKVKVHFKSETLRN